MDRREFLTLGGVGGVFVGSVGGLGWFVSGGNNNTESESSTKPAENPPKAVRESKPLAEKFHSRIRDYFSDSRVFIRRDGEVVMEYITHADSKKALETELHRIAKEYATVVKQGDYTPATLSIITDEVQAIAPEDTVRAFVNDDINEKAYLKTIGVTDVKRRTQSES